MMQHGLLIVTNNQVVQIRFKNRKRVSMYLLQAGKTVQTIHMNMSKAMKVKVMKTIKMKANLQGIFIIMISSIILLECTQRDFRLQVQLIK